MVHREKGFQQVKVATPEHGPAGSGCRIEKPVERTVKPEIGILQAPGISGVNRKN